MRFCGAVYRAGMTAMMTLRGGSVSGIFPFLSGAVPVMLPSKRISPSGSSQVYSSDSSQVSSF